MIEQYRDELITSLRGSVDDMRVAEDREAVASDLLNILHRLVPFTDLLVRFHSSGMLRSIPIQSIATNGPSLVRSPFIVARVRYC